MRRFLLFIFLMSFAAMAVAQNEGNIWYFGDNAGVDFNSGAPVVLLNGALSTNEGCATISDNTGSVLFYTDGITAYDASHAVMSNGTGLMGNSSSTQSAIIVKQPGNNSMYYLFTVDNNAGPDGLRYSTVDMSSNGGLGAITANKNTLVSNNTCEKITAVTHANGSDYWIVSHLFNSNSFVSYLLTSTGLSTTPVTSNVGINVTGATGNSIGYLKANINGTKMVSANWSMDNVELFDFDNSTGVLSNAITFIGFNGSQPYGVEFSPNNQLLYVSEAAASGSRLLQYNLMAGTPTQIANSRVTIATWSSYAGAIQLAPDQKIYQTRYGENYLAVVNNPDIIGLGCNYVANGFYLGGQECRHGLPTFYNSIITSPGPFSYTNLCEGDSTEFIFTASSLDSVLWNFGDVSSGIHNTSTVFEPKHVFSDSGYFNISVIAYFGANVDTLYDTLYINPNPIVNLGNDTTLCIGDVLTVNAATGNASYNWSTGSGDSSIVISQSGIYSVEVTVNGCTTSDSIGAVFYVVPIVDLGKDTSLCDGSSLLLDATQANASYLWQNNSSASTQLATQTGLYTCEVTISGCKTTDSITVTFNPNPVVNLGNDTSLCAGESLVLDAFHSGATYLWNNNSTGSNYNVTQAGSYWVEVNLNNCYASDSINVSYNPLPVVDLGNDTVLCAGNPLTLNATYPNSTYLWQNNSTNPIINVTQSGIYWVDVILNNCSVSDSITVTIHPLPVVNLGNDTSICIGANLSLDASLAGATYLWSNSTISSTLNASLPGVYWVDVTLNNCTSRDSLLLGNDPLPVVDLGNDTTLCQGEEIEFDLAVSNANYLWNNGNTTSSLVVTQPGNIWVRLTIGSCSNSDSITIAYNALPITNLGEDSTLCDGEALVLNVQFPNATYFWQDNSTNSFYQVVQEDVYWVEVSLGHCSFTDSIYVAYNPNPMVNIGNDTIVCIGDTIAISANQLNATYLWNDGSSNATYNVYEDGVYWVEVTIDNCNTTDSVEYTFYSAPKIDLGLDTYVCFGQELILNAETAGANYLWQDFSTGFTYTVTEPGTYWVEVTNICGTDLDTIDIAPKECYCSIYVPNAFSPNADGRNDLVVPKTNCSFIDYTLQIFNRWGDLVFESTSPREGWRGLKDGDAAPQGVYVYLLTYQFPENKRMLKTGNVTLIR